MTIKTEAQDVREMTADTVGRDILQALVQEIKLLPDVWPKISQSKQNDVIDRLRSRVDHNIKMAVHLLAAQGRTVVAGSLDQITIKDGVKAVIKFGVGAPSLQDLYEANGKAVLVVVANAADNTAGMDEVKGESDQRAMNLGDEYDPNGDGKGMDNVVDSGTAGAEVKQLTAPNLSWPFQSKKAADQPVKTTEPETPSTDLDHDEPTQQYQWKKGDQWVDLDLLELQGTDGQFAWASDYEIKAIHRQDFYSNNAIAANKQEAIKAALDSIVDLINTKPKDMKKPDHESLVAWYNNLRDQASADQ